MILICLVHRERKILVLGDSCAASGVGNAEDQIEPGSLYEDAGGTGGHASTGAGGGHIVHKHPKTDPETYVTVSGELT